MCSCQVICRYDASILVIDYHHLHLLIVPVEVFIVLETRLDQLCYALPAHHLLRPEERMLVFVPYAELHLSNPQVVVTEPTEDEQVGRGLLHDRLC